MKIFVSLIFLSWVSQNHCEKEISGIKISYEDLKEINGSCYPRDSCLENRQHDPPGIYSSVYSCSCDEKCSELDTCCIDSPYRGVPPPMVKESCRTYQDYFIGGGFYMVQTCSNGGSGNSVWKDLCEDEWNGEDDTTKIAPVTSLYTNRTYKNYYCFRCHETTDEFLFWNIILQNNSHPDEEVKDKDVRVTYNRDYETWMATVPGEGGLSIPVKLQFFIPEEINSLPIYCDSSVISRCSDTWVDKSTAEKCNAYTAIINILRGYDIRRYKNPHCALCNFESLDDMYCSYSAGGAGMGGSGDKTFFPFYQLLDINRSDGDKVGKIKKCEDNYLWDPYGKKCRKISCALPGYIIKDGQCTPP